MKTKIALAIHRLGISANFLTVSGLILAALSGWLIFRGEFFLASAVLLTSGIFDMLDGAVARVSGKESAFGGILDSSLDRYGDSFLFAGLVFYFFQLNRLDLAVLSVSAWTGSFLISYVRARVECEFDSCRVGFWERGERLGVLIVALAVNNVAGVVWLLGIGTHWTALQRLYSATPNAPKFKTPTRFNWVYFAKVIFLAMAILFVRFP